MSKTTFTSRQLRQWRQYERVRKSGKYDMFDPRARAATRIADRDEYLFVMQNYSAIKEAVEAESKAT